MSEPRTDLLCKDCAHSFIPWHTYLFAFGSKKHLFYLCKKFPVIDEKTINLVTGPQERDKEYKMCGIVRKCGPEGKGWTPKNKKHLFLALTK
jgi:hypothetical protein